MAAIGSSQGRFMRTCLVFFLAMALGPLLLLGAPPDRTEFAPISSSGVDLVTEGQSLVGPRGPREADEAGDSPGILGEDRLAPISHLAARLSRDRSWLTQESLQILDLRALSLDELFNAAPRYLSLDGVLYRVRLEKVGKLWGGFDTTSDPFVVFLTHEVYKGLGENRALGYQEGQEVILFAADFERVPAVALTLARAPQDVPLLKKDMIAELGTENIALGQARSTVAFRPEGAAARRTPAPQGTMSYCPGEVAPVSCSGSLPVCPSSYRSFFVVQALRVFDNLEGCCFHGDPEIELYPLRLDSFSLPGGSPFDDQKTEWVFDGTRDVIDNAGRSRRLPDIDDNGSWYSVNLAVFPLDIGQSWSALLVEDDDSVDERGGAPGRLQVSPIRNNTTRVLGSFQQIGSDVRRMDLFYLYSLGALRDILQDFGDVDDLYQPALGFTTSLFCSDALGAPFPKVYTMSAPGQWDLQGYFACINPACDDGGKEPPPTCPPPPRVCDA